MISPRYKNMPLESGVVNLMRKNPLFKDLTDEAFQKVTEHCSLRELKAGEFLFRQHQPAPFFFLLISGQIKLSLLSMEGTEKVVDIIHAGNSFSEAIMFRSVPSYPVNAEALADVNVLSIEAATYSAILRSSPDACFKVMGCLSVRLHWLMTELDRLTLHNVTYRLIIYLLEDIPEGVTEAVKVNLTIPKRVIASRISVTPETLSRTLKRLSEQGLMDIHDHHIVLNNPTELRRMVSI